MPSAAPTVAILIPARYGSARFPGKPLADLGGKPVIQHVYESVLGTPHVKEIQVVTDDSRIQQTVEGFGGRACVVSKPCRTGTDRIAEAASNINCDVLINLQGDEIPLHQGLLGDLIEPFLESQARIGTLKRRIRMAKEIHQPSIVKVTTSSSGQALYFSRSPIPFVRDGQPSESDFSFYMHLGLYIFRRETLFEFARLPTGILEEAEKLEQLRALEHNIPIQVWETSYPSIRIDQEEDLEEANTLLSQRENPKLQTTSVRS